MSIRWIVNGYFRSGTTLLWDLCRQALPEGSLALYEPLHPDLACRLSRCGSSPDPLHGRDIWTDYFRLPSDQLRLVLEHHPNRNWKADWSRDALWRYLDRYHDLPSPVFLQTNRLHFELAAAAERYAAPAVHIIRHPLAVFRSIRRVYLGRVPCCRRLYRMASYPFRGKDAFETDAFCRKGLALLNREQDLRRRCFGLLRAFVPAWVTANAAVLTSCREENALVILYEELVARPEATADLLGRHLGLPLAVEPGKIHYRETRVSARDTMRWRRLVARGGLEAEMNAIDQFVKQRGVQWWQP